jgi:hypothetical protein
MLLKSEIAVSLALVLGTASVATAATKHSVHVGQSVGVRQAQPASYGMPVYDSKYAYDSVLPSSQGSSPSGYPSNPFLDPEFIAPQGLR